MNIQELRKTVHDKLIKCGIEDASFKTDLLICHILNMSKTELLLKYNQIVDQDTEESINKSMLDIINGKPIQYIINKKYEGIGGYAGEKLF